MDPDQQAAEIVRLQAKLDSETRKLQELIETNDKESQARDATEKRILKDARTAKFYQDKLKLVDLEGTRSRLDKLNIQFNTLATKQRRLRELEMALEEFNSFEPTNEALRRKIDELKKSRLSFDMSFLD